MLNRTAYCLSLSIKLSVALLLFNSCSKPNDSPDYGQGIGGCQLNKSTYWVKVGTDLFDLSNTSYEYDNSGRITKHSRGLGSTTTNFRYHSGGFYQMCNGSTDSFFIDNNNRITRYYVHQYGVHSTLYYIGDKPEYEVTGKAGSPNDTTRYFWENGDLKKVITWKDTIEYTYYEDEKYQIGSYRLHTLNMFEAETQWPFIMPKHLVKSKQLRRGLIEMFSYEFDNEHRITKMMRTDPQRSYTAYTTYRYNCK